MSDATPGADKPINHAEAGFGETIVFIPGLGSTIASLQHQLLHFSTDHRTIAVELRGSGDSPLLDTPVRRVIPSQAEDVVELLGSKKIARAHLVGVGYGGAVASQIAVDHPELVRSLTMIDTVADHSARSVTERLFSASQLIQPAAYFMPKSLRAGAVLNQYVTRWPAAGHILAAEMRELRPKEVALQQRAYNLVRLLTPLRTIQAPALVLAGEAAPWLMQHARRIAGVLPNGRWETVRGALNPSTLTQPKTCNQQIRNFISEQH